MDSTKDIHKLLRPTKEINLICKRCRNYAPDAEVAFDCFSKECPSTNKKVQITSWGTNKTRKPTWKPT